MSVLNRTQGLIAHASNFNHDHFLVKYHLSCSYVGQNYIATLGKVAENVFV